MIWQMGGLAWSFTGENKIGCADHRSILILRQSSLLRLIHGDFYSVLW
jgi:hypothetical protein